jgi:Uma2 family endonuclease
MVAGPPQVERERRITLDGVSWSLYQSLLAEAGNSHLKLTYDCGRLEIMSPLPIHEQVKKVTARLVETYSDLAGIEAEGLGSTTFAREDLQKGLEPDECYYVQHASEVIGRNRFDWQVDPPPDLAIEVDISRPDIARQPIYAALGVAEIWRYGGKAFTYLLRHQSRGAAAEYITSERNDAFPSLPLTELNRLVQIGLEQGQTAAVRALHSWFEKSGK